MNNQSDNHRLSPTILAGIGAALVVLAGGGVAWWTLKDKNSTSPPVISSPVPTPTSAVIIPVPPPSPAASPSTPTLISPSPNPQIATGQTGVTAYWFRETDGQLQLVASPLSIRAGESPQIQLEKAFNQLLSGTPPEQVSTAIPGETKLLKLTVKNEGIYLDLSREFTQGGGSDSMIARLGQIIYTATSLKPESSVWISVEGKPLEVLGGEGLEVSQPISRQLFHQNFSQ